MTHSFAHGGHGYTNEIVVKRNGAVISDGGPMWTRTFDRPARELVLQQAGWEIVYGGAGRLWAESAPAGFASGKDRSPCQAAVPPKVLIREGRKRKFLPF